MRAPVCIIVCLFLLPLLQAQDSSAVVKDTLLFRGMLSPWVIFNPSGTSPVWLGGRYIPQLNYEIHLPSGKLIDVEASANLSAQAGLGSSDTAILAGNISPYRLWARYSNAQFEARLGLQKINFGSATIMRPLMWFDQVDPRDPLQLTNGVWGFLGRYYFLNNTNIWLWILHGSNKPRTWELAPSKTSLPEFGGRFQSAIKRGEAGISYHHRITDTRQLGLSAAHVPENRIGFDAKWDLVIGLWVEGVWINKKGDIGMFSNQQIATVGADYTFGIGNGLNFIAEQFVTAFGNDVLSPKQYVTLSALALSYPLTMFDNVSCMVYYDHHNKNIYRFVNWKHQFNKFYVYLMAYWNPDNTLIPQQQTNQANLFAGRGLQLMLVYNH